MAQHLAMMRTMHTYDQVLDWGKDRLQRTPVVGNAMYQSLHGMKKGIKDVLSPQRGMFEDLGLKYVGPVDGHDITALLGALAPSTTGPAPPSDRPASEQSAPAIALSATPAFTPPPRPSRSDVFNSDDTSPHSAHSATP